MVNEFKHTKVLGEVMEEVTSGMDASATQQYEMNLHLIASLEATVEDIAQTSNENFDSKIEGVNKHLYAIKDEISKSANTNASLVEKMDVLNQSIIELTKQLKAHKLCDTTESRVPVISSPIPRRVNAEDFIDQKGIIVGNDGKIGDFDDGDW